MLGQPFSRMFQRTLDFRRLRMSLTEYALPRIRNRLEYIHALAEIAERGAFVHVERPRVNPPHLERDIITLSKNASRYGNHFEQKWFGFFEAL